MLLKLIKQARVTLAPGTVVEVSGAQASYLLSTKQAEVAVATTPEKAQAETADNTPKPVKKRSK